LIVAAAVMCVLVASAVANRDWKEFTFARLVWKRDQRCSVRDAWAAVDGNRRLCERIGEIADGSRVLETDPAGFELVEAEGKKYWIPLRNRLALAEMIGEQETDVYGTTGRGVRQGDIVLDCGANVGVYTRRALDAGARHCVPKGSLGQRRHADAQHVRRRVGREQCRAEVCRQPEWTHRAANHHRQTGS